MSKDGIIIFSRGVNGHTTYSIFTAEKRPIMVDRGIEDITKKLIDSYPEDSKQISNFYQSDFSGELPERIDLSRLDSTPKADLIKSISKLSRANKV